MDGEQTLKKAFAAEILCGLSNIVSYVGECGERMVCVCVCVCVCVFVFVESHKEKAFAAEM